MAIDGVGIIDSDFAHDIYDIIMEMYHSGESIEDIRDKIDEINPACGLDYEIFTTAYALAMWEIDGLTNIQLQAIKDIVSKGASGLWIDIHPNAQRARQRVLNMLLQKIEKPNLKIKKRNMYKRITNTLFSKGEILAININNHYRSVIFEDFYQYQNDAYYSFVVTTYNSNIVPTEEDILIEEIPVTKKNKAGEYGIRMLNIYYKFIEEHKTNFLKSDIIHLNPQNVKSGFSTQISGFDRLQDMEKAMDNILLGEKVELYVCCLF